MDRTSEYEVLDREIYSQKDKTRLLVKGKCCGFPYIIISFRGMHPNAYVNVTNTPLNGNSDYTRMEFFPIHDNELTFAGSFDYDFVDKGNWWIGWDYAHWGDHIERWNIQWQGINHPKKWSIGELIEDAESVCEQLARKYSDISA